MTVDFETGDRTAVAGHDYLARSASAVIPASRTRVDVDVGVLDDTVPEGAETFVLRLTAARNVPLSRDTVASPTIEEQ